VRCILKQIRKQIVCVTAAVLHDCNRDIEIRWQVPDETAQRSQSSPRRTYNHDRCADHRTFR